MALNTTEGDSTARGNQLEQRVAELEMKLQNELVKISSIEDIGRALGSTLHLDELLGLIMEKITPLMGAERSTMFLVDEETDHIWSKITQGEDLLEIRQAMGTGISGWVAKTGKSINIKDAYQDPRFNKEIDQQTGYRTRSILCMPMKNNKGRTIGVVQVLNKQTGYFSPDDEALLAAMIAQAAISIENSKLYLSVVNKNMELIETQEKLEQKMSELDVLYEIEKEISCATELTELLNRIISRAMELLHAEAGSIVLKEDDTNQMYFKSARGRKAQSVKLLKLRKGEGIAGWVAGHGESLICNDAMQDERHLRNFADQIGFPTREIICVPLMGEDEVIGAFELINKESALSGFTTEDLKLLTLIAGQAAKAIQTNRHREKLEKADRLATIGQFLSGILHDFKTPMSIISGYVQLMAEKTSDGDRKAYISSILKQFDLMNTMTKEILAFARGESEILVRKVYLNKFFEEINELLSREFEDRNITYQLNMNYRGIAHMDENKIKRVFYNMVRNAAEAMQEGGSFTLSVDKEEHHVAFTFSDTGLGIPEEIKDRLFDSFVSKGKADGTGLGLAIVKKIIDEHQGHINYSSNPERGTTFVIRLPL